MDLKSVVDELYGLPPDVFTAARDARASEARGAGDRELASSIKKLRRPSASAWLANMLVRAQRDTLEELLSLGQAMRRAQADLDGDELRRLSLERRRIVHKLAVEARTIATKRGQGLSDSAARELEMTLEAAVADGAAAEALKSGRLVSALHFSGFDPVHLTDAVAKSPEPVSSKEQGSRGQTRRQRRPATTQPLGGGEGPAAQIAKAELTLRIARDEARESEREATAQEQRWFAQRDELERIRSELASAENHVRELRKAVTDFADQLRRLDKERSAAERRMRAARDKAAKAADALDEVRGHDG
ncbi:MAG TPA: hypothetical protein VEJ87_10220 [Acidimicrobiales bacterium]|nr:hypothetical protein [Acidimicrobiales bacterium]